MRPPRFHCGEEFDPFSGKPRGVAKESIAINSIVGFPSGSVVKNPPAMQETEVPSLGRRDPLEKEMATHSNNPAWRIPWTEGPGRLWSMGPQQVGHN